MTLNALISSYFQSLTNNVDVISQGEEMYRYTDNFDWETDKVSTFNVEAVFGIVPAFDSEGYVSFYIRYGGPEHLKYHPNATFSVEALTNGLSSGYGEAAAKFAQGYSSIFDGDEELSYIPSTARERHFIQTAYSKLGDRDAETFLSSFYPFKLNYNSKQGKFMLQYVPFGTNTYKNIDANGIAEDAMLSFVLELSEYDKKINPDDPPINVFTNVENIESATTSFFEKLKSDFGTQVKARLYTADNDYGNNNDNDVPYVAAFVQHKVKQKYQNPEDITTRVSEVAKNFTDWLTGTENSKIAKSISEFFSTRLPNDDTLTTTLSQTQNTLNEAQNAKHALEVTNSSLKSQLMNTQRSLEDTTRGSSRVRYFGAAAGAGAAFLALQQDEVKDLEMWQKGAIVATGALLGMVPYLNLITIGASSYLVREGLNVTREYGPRATTAFKARMSRNKEPSEA